MRARTITAAVLAFTLAAPAAVAHADRGSGAAAVVPAAPGAAFAPVVAPARGDQHSVAVDLAVETGGFTAPAELPAGSTTFRIRSADPEGAYLGVLRIRPGFTLRRVLDTLESAYDHADPEAARAAARTLAEQVVMLGGAAVLPSVPVSYTAELAAGTYHLIDFKEIGRPGLEEKVRALHVRPSHRRPAPPASVRIVQYEAADGTGRFAAPAAIAAGRPVRVINRTSQFNEAILMPVRPGTTREQVGAFFAAMERREQVASPFIGGPTGLVPISPGRSATFQADLPPGTYALVTWLPDHNTGVGHAAQGMHEIITVE
ncbi:hypothetical protein JYK22_17795, partial [Nonomuraea sp. RK-328]|nr:hypothetical protein [Nonomuraea sp. RK-328]